MLQQTDQPLVHTSMSPTNRPLEGFVYNYSTGRLLLNPPYQRGDVWTDDQRGLLIRSLLMGVPTHDIIINKRLTDAWQKLNGLSPYNDVVIDGQQRILTVVRWFDGEFGVPASWFQPSWLAEPVDLDARPMVTFAGLSSKGRRSFENFTFSCAQAQVTSVEAEAEIYSLVNGGGTPQTDADMANAQRVAEGK